MLALDGRAVSAQRAMTEWVDALFLRDRAATLSGRFAATFPIEGKEVGSLR
jgi:hypothetical protein